jgi:hypothetical protein
LQVVAPDEVRHNFNFEGQSEPALKLLSRVRQLIEWHLDAISAHQVRHEIVSGKMPSVVLRELMLLQPGLRIRDGGRYLIDAFDDSALWHYVWNWQHAKNSEIWDTQFNIWTIGALLSRGVSLPWTAEYCESEYARIQPLIADEIAAEREVEKQARSFEVLRDRIRSLAGEPTCIQALWDGDSRGWFINLGVVMREGVAFKEHHLAVISLGNDARLFNGQVPPWPESIEAQELVSCSVNS